MKKRRRRRKKRKFCDDTATFNDVIDSRVYIVNSYSVYSNLISNITGVTIIHTHTEALGSMGYNFDFKVEQV